MSARKKSYKDYHRRLLFTESDKSKFFHEFEQVVSLGDQEKVKILLDIMKKEGQLKELASYKGEQGASMLHLAAMFNKSSEIIRELIKVCPALMTAARKESEDYYGQTALHVAIAKGNTDAVEEMLAEILNLSQSHKTALLHTVATGHKFANTVMMGELPLSVAALTFDTTMMENLLQNGAEMERKNTKGDTVFHSLIRFAAIYPEHLQNVLTTMQFLHDYKIKEKLDMPNILSIDYDHSDYSYIWFVPNSEELNPLQLAASLSQPIIFDFILQLPKVYCFLNSHDGLFDRKSYDITEIDTIATEKWAKDQKVRHKRMQRHVAPTAAQGVSQKKFANSQTTTCGNFEFKRVKKKSILEIMFDVKSSAAFDFIQQPIMRHVIKTKWLYYRWFYYIWAIFHILFMVTLTVYSVLKADDYIPTTEVANTSKNESPDRQRFLLAYSIIYVIFAVILVLLQLIHLTIMVKSYNLQQLTNVLHNGIYRIILAIFSISLILEFAFSMTLTYYENYCLIVALITGWWFTVFFLRAWKKFSFFTVMIQKIIFGDLLRFSFIIVLMLIAFTAAVFMTFKGSHTTDDNLLSYGHTMMLLFKLMLGLGDIEALYEARRPWMAVTLFTVFVVLTYVLMFNALIAMMSQTCAFVSDNRHVQWRVQQLSIIMFFEGQLPGFMKKLVGEEKAIKRFDTNFRQVVEETRYFVDISSLQTEYASAEDLYSMKHKFLTQQFTDLHRTTHQNFNMTIPTQNYLIPPQYNAMPVIRTPTSPNARLPITPKFDQEQINEPNSSPALKHRKSARDKSPSKQQPQDVPIDAANDPTHEVHTKAKYTKKGHKKKRVEPEGHNVSYEDQSETHHKFYLNQGHLQAPSTHPMKQESPVTERRRYHSEGGLIDTHIGGHEPQQFPIKRVQPIPGQQEGSLDIGVIEDSYM